MLARNRVVEDHQQPAKTGNEARCVESVNGEDITGGKVSSKSTTAGSMASCV